MRFDPYLLEAADGEEDAEEVEEAGSGRELGYLVILLGPDPDGSAWKRGVAPRTLPRRPVFGKTVHLGCTHLIPISRS